MRLLYSFLYTCAFLLILPYFLIIGLFRGKYLSSAKQRFGFIPQSSERPSCWIHAVSVGEFLAAKPLIKKIQENFPEIRLFVSTTTITGQSLARNLMPDSTFYFPFDWGWCIRRVLLRLRPQLILVLETEIWPNFLWEAQRQKIPVILVNGRLSNRSFFRYRLVDSWLPNFDECWMQTEEDAGRMQVMAPQCRKIEVMGNLKFDFHPLTMSPSLRQLLLEWKGTDLLWIAGSTMRGEEEQLLDVFQKLSRTHSLKLLIAPRHPERFEEVANLVSQKGISFARRSQEATAGTSVLILDTIGELAASYEMADVVIVGGTVAKYGGHNPIEPAYFGKAILTGPHYENFRAIFEEFQKRDAISISNALCESMKKLLDNPEQRTRMGLAAQAIVRENAGATEFVLQNMRKYLAQA